MRKCFLLLPVALMMMGVIACSEKKGCSIEGHTSFNQYQKAYLIDLDGNRLDSVNMEDGKFGFQMADNVVSPYALMVHLQENHDPYDWIEMPVFIENGMVTMEIGDVIHISGTSLNDGLQEFFDSLQHSKDATKVKKDITIEEVEATFSEFYKQQILMNKDNALGRYIYREYGSNMKEVDRKHVEAQMAN